MGSREPNFKVVLFMAVQVMLCEHNEFYQNGHEFYSSVAVSAENLKQQDNNGFVTFPLEASLFVN